MQTRPQMQIWKLTAIIDGKKKMHRMASIALPNKYLNDTPSCQSLWTYGLQVALLGGEGLNTLWNFYFTNLDISTKDAVNNLMWNCNIWVPEHSGIKQKETLHIPENAFRKLTTKSNIDVIFQLQLGVHLGRNSSGNKTSDWVDKISFYGGWQSLSAGSR